MLANKINISKWAVFLYINIDHEQLEFLFFFLGILRLDLGSYASVQPLSDSPTLNSELSGRKLRKYFI